MASKTHRHQLKRHRQPESSPVDVRRRRSPAFGTQPSRETTLNHSLFPILFFSFSLDYVGVSHLACPLMFVCLRCFSFGFMWVPIREAHLKPKGEGLK